MKLYLRTIIGDSKGSYSGTTLKPFQGMCQGNGGASEGWFMISFIIIIYLKENIHEVEIKNATPGDDFKLVIMMFVDNRDSSNLGKRIYI